MTKYVRTFTSSFLTSVGNAAARQFHLGSFVKAAKIKMLIVETFRAAEAAIGKSSRCRCYTTCSQTFRKNSQKNICAEVSFL